MDSAQVYAGELAPLLAPGERLVSATMVQYLAGEERTGRPERGVTFDVVNGLSVPAWEAATERALGGVSDSLWELARRQVEAERAKPRIVVRQVTGVTIVALGAALITNPTYFAPFTHGIGQLIALLLAALYLAALTMLRRMAATRQRDRILQRRPVPLLEAAHG